MSTGIVEMYDEDRGFGFIQPDDGGADVFVHAKSIIGASVLQPRQQVEFESEFDSARASHSAVMGRRQNQIMRTSLALYFPRALAAEVPCSAPVSD